MGLAVLHVITSYSIHYTKLYEGMCGVCRVTVDGEMKFGCVDGPEFDGHKTNFDELILRQRTMLPEERLSSLLWEMSSYNFV